MPRAIPAPTLADVRPEDLAETGRTLALFDQAVARGIVGASEADRLRWLSAAEHARAAGTVNAPGLFAHLIRRRLWGYATQADEDAAARKLRDHLRGVPKMVPVSGRPRPPHPPEVDGPAAAPSSLGEVLARLMRQPAGSTPTRPGGGT